MNHDLDWVGSASFFRIRTGKFQAYEKVNKVNFFHKLSIYVLYEIQEKLRYISKRNFFYFPTCVKLWVGSAWGSELFWCQCGSGSVSTWQFGSGSGSAWKRCRSTTLYSSTVWLLPGVLASARGFCRAVPHWRTLPEHNRPTYQLTHSLYNELIFSYVDLDQRTLAGFEFCAGYNFKFRKFIFLKCLMFSFEGWGLLLYLGRSLWRPQDKGMTFFDKKKR